MAKLILNDIEAGYLTHTAYNTNNTLIETALENTLSRDGTTPNQMGANLDMDSHRILNLAQPLNSNEAARLSDVQNAIAGSTAANLISFTPYANIASDTVQGAIQEEVDDLASSSGSSLVGFLQSGSGAVARTVQDKERETISAADFSTLQQALDTGKIVELQEATYAISAGLVIPVGGGIVGKGKTKSIISYSGNADAVRASAHRGLILRDFAILGTASATAGVKLEGCWNSDVNNVKVTNCTSGKGFHIIGNAVIGGSYYNVLNNCHSGDTGAPNAFGFYLDTDDAGTNRVNANELNGCRTAWTTNSGFYLNRGNGNTFVGCVAERVETAGYGLQLENAVRTSILGGYFENNSFGGDISLGTSTLYSRIIGPALLSTSKIVGASIGSSGDVYQVSSSATSSSTTYGNWAQNYFIRDLKARDIEFNDKTAEANIVYAKLSTDSGGYRNKYSIYGRQTQGDGTGIDDIVLHSRAAIQTTDATVTTLATIAPGTGKGCQVRVLVTGIGAAGVKNAGYELQACGYNTAGTMAIIGTVTTVSSHESDAAMDCTIVASGATLLVRVTGIAATTINWVASIDYVVR